MGVKGQNVLVWWRLFGLVVRRSRCRKRVFHRGVRMTHPCLGGNCLPRVCGNWDRDLAALTPRCAAGPYRWSMGNPAHTATQRVNLRIQGPKHPPIGPNTPPIPRAMPPSTHARTRPTLATNARPALAAHTRTQSGAGLVTCVRTTPTTGPTTEPPPETWQH